MIELRGKYGEAKVFTDVVDQESISQVINLLNQPYVEGSRVRMMPDIHAGAGCTIGTTMTITDKICPNYRSSLWKPPSWFADCELLPERRI